MQKNVWTKAEASTATGGCVEVMETDTAILVRDSKNPEQAPKAFTRHEWKCFLDGARKGEFDL